MDIRFTETRYGEMAYYEGDLFVGRSLELYGEYSPGEMELCRKFVRPDWVIVNGGANIGAITVALASLVPQGKVYAFEPQPEAFKLLEGNVKDLENVEACNQALWHSGGDSKIRLYEQLSVANFGNTRIGDDEGKADVKMVALDEWLTGRKVDFIYLDIEGCEVHALEGARRTIERDRPVLYIENDGQGAFEPLPYVRRMDYFCYEHKPHLYSKENWKGQRENVFVEDGGEYVSFNLLCVPKERVAEYRHVIEQTKFFFDSDRNKLKMIVPKSPARGVKNWAAFCRGGGVGDNLIAASVARPLKEMGFNVEVITQTPNDVVYENNPFIDRISVHDAEDFPADGNQWQEWFRVRAKEYGKFANYGHSVECRHALFSNQTWYWWPQEYRRKMCAGNYIETAHDIIGVPHTFGPLFFPTDEEREHAHITKLKIGHGPFIAWCLSGTRVDKVYPYAPLVISRLIKELDAQVVLLGAPPPHRDSELAQQTMEIVKAHNGTLDGLTHGASPDLKNQTWPVRRIITFAMACDLYVGGDTGPSWGVAFEKIPKIIMLSHASEENITKNWVNTVALHADQGRVPCWPCHRLHDNFKYCVANKINEIDFSACISDISAEAVVSTARKLLCESHNAHQL